MVKIFNDEKGVASAELLFVTLIFIIIAGSFVGLISSSMDNTQTGDLGKVRIVGEKIATTINTVYKNGAGYSIDLDLRDDVDYYADINSTGYVTMRYNGQSIPIKLIAIDNMENITMNDGDRYKVYNDNGTIRFTAI
ncbi:MAG: hypothetical protein ACPK7O_04410 [Methanobacterium sp.]